MIKETEPSEHSGCPVEYLPDRSPNRWRYLYGKRIADRVTYTHLRNIPLSTRRWIRNAADERCAQMLVDGKPIYRVSESLGQSVVDWVEKYCVLYQGPTAGNPMEVEDWQYEFFMQSFGWLHAHPSYRKWIRRFKTVSVWIAKKNAKSPTLAAAGLYVFCGEGEKGQNCYSLARDGDQALIQHQHAVNMVELSPKLSQECVIRKTDWSIYHPSTRSKYKVVHGRNYKSSEGLNGSYFLDETHVVDTSLMDSVRRCGISRVQPFGMEFSTAGDMSDGYGRSQFDRGTRLETLTNEDDFDPSFLFINFSIPQDFRVDKITTDKEVLRIAVKTNPGIGRLFPREEILTDWKASRYRPSERAKFFRYRFGKWEVASQNWIEMASWLACGYKGKQLLMEMLKPYPCAVGVDLSTRSDTTAVTYSFGVPREGDPSDLILHTIPFFWIPQKAVLRYRGKTPLVDFEKSLTIVPEEALDHRIMAQHITYYRNLGYDIRGVGYDPFHSANFLDHMTKVCDWSESELRKVPTTIGSLAPSTRDIEALILNGDIVHDNNPFMNWQMSHTCLYQDRVGNSMPCKPGSSSTGKVSGDDPRKIDGVISLINSAAVSVDKDIGFRTIASFTATTEKE